MLVRIVVMALAVCGTRADRQAINEAVFDLSYSYDNNTPHWPTVAGFSFSKQIAQEDSSGKWYASNDFCTGEHGGTHLDAPYHFYADGWKVGDVPVSKLINKGYVLDVAALGDAPTANTTLQPRHIQQFEQQVFGARGRLPADAILLIRFNWGRYYGTKEYYNAAAGPAEGELQLSFPGITPEAARLLVERQVAGVGVDTASMDPGSSTTFDAHRILYRANIYGMENVNIPAELAQYNGRLVVYAMPMKIREGTGAPCRILAVVPKAHH